MTEPDESVEHNDTQEDPSLVQESDVDDLEAMSYTSVLLEDTLPMISSLIVFFFEQTCWSFLFYLAVLGTFLTLVSLVHSVFLLKRRLLSIPYLVVILVSNCVLLLAKPGFLHCL